jgi:hypothetical protein
MFKKYVLAIAIALALTVPVARADDAIPAISFQLTPANVGTDDPQSLGWVFSTNTDVAVSALGFYVGAQNGLTQTHEVGIYDLSGNLLVSTTVSSSDPLVGWFAYHPVATTVLSAGGTYVIAAETGADPLAWNPNGFTVSPSINWVSDAWVYSDSLVFPTGSDYALYGVNTNGYFGPNFLDPVETPEPATITLFLLGGGLLSAVRRRKQR